jgi:nuclear pore complex protein Nup93
MLLANKGFDATRIARALQSIDLKSTFEPLDAIDDTDLDAYLQHQHDLLILTAIEEAKRLTSDEFHTSFMQQMEEDW